MAVSVNAVCAVPWGLGTGMQSVSLRGCLALTAMVIIVSLFVFAGFAYTVDCAGHGGIICAGTHVDAAATGEEPPEIRLVP